MKIKNIVITVMIVLGMNSVELCAQNESIYNDYIARLVRAGLTHPPGNFGNYLVKPNGEKTEDILSELINSKNGIWKKFSYKQKRELTFIAVLFCDIEGGSSTKLLILLGKDSSRIANELLTISSQRLKDRFYLNDEGISHYRNVLKFLSGRNRITP